jgi:hypothetical protein
MGAILGEYLGPSLYLLPVTAPAMAFVIVAFVRVRGPGRAARIVACVLAWATGPLWAGVPILIGFGMAVHAGAWAMALLACVPAAVVTALAVWMFPRAWAALALGAATWVAPIVAVVAVEASPGPWMAVLAALAWDFWVVVVAFAATRLRRADRASDRSR